MSKYGGGIANCKSGKRNDKHPRKKPGEDKIPEKPADIQNTPITWDQIGGSH